MLHKTKRSRPSRNAAGLTVATVAAAALALTGCGGGSSSGASAGGGGTTASDTFTASSAQVAPVEHQLEIDWQFDGSPDDFIVEVNRTGASGYTQADVNGDGQVDSADALAASATRATIEISPHLTLFDKALYRVVARDDQGNEIDATAGIDLTGLATRKFAHYIKASNAGSGDQFGTYDIALSDDGDTMAVGAAQESSAATSIGGDQTNDSATNAGAVYVFTRSDGAWSQQAYLKADNADAGDFFGRHVSLSDSGDTLVVGAPNEDSDATGINAADNNNSLFAGAAYVFERASGNWAELAYLKASNTGYSDYFGASVAVSGDGKTIAVGAWQEDSAATSINGNASDDSARNAGAVYVFTETSAKWSPQAYIKASNIEAEDQFGSSIALSTSGDTMIVGAPGEDSSATDVGGNPSADSGADDAGAAYVFHRASGSWDQQAYLKASNTGADDRFGSSVAIATEGDDAAVGAPGEAGGGGFDSPLPGDNSLNEAGAVYTFLRSGTSWSAGEYLKATRPGAGDFFGYSVSLSRNAAVIAIGSIRENGASKGIGGDPTDDSADDAGAVYVYTTGGLANYVKASNTDAGDNFGGGVALSGDGRTLAVAAPYEEGGGQGVDADPTDNSAGHAGAVYVY